MKSNTKRNWGGKRKPSPGKRLGRPKAEPTAEMSIRVPVHVKAWYTEHAERKQVGVNTLARLALEEYVIDNEKPKLA